VLKTSFVNFYQFTIQNSLMFPLLTFLYLALPILSNFFHFDDSRYFSSVLGTRLHPFISSSFQLQLLIVLCFWKPLNAYFNKNTLYFDLNLCLYSLTCVLALVMVWINWLRCFGEEIGCIVSYLSVYVFILGVGLLLHDPLLVPFCLAILLQSFWYFLQVFFPPKTTNLILLLSNFFLSKYFFSLFFF